MVLPPPRIVYDAIGRPPVEGGSPNRIDTRPSPATAVTLRGVDGTAIPVMVGVTLWEGREAVPVPLALRALTVKLSSSPLVRPPSTAYPVVRNCAAEMVAMCPKAACMTYAEAAEPPSSTGGAQAT